MKGSFRCAYSSRKRSSIFYFTRHGFALATVCTPSGTSSLFGNGRHQSQQKFFFLSGNHHDTTTENHRIDAVLVFLTTFGLNKGCIWFCCKEKGVRKQKKRRHCSYKQGIRCSSSYFGRGYFQISNTYTGCNGWYQQCGQPYMSM